MLCWKHILLIFICNLVFGGLNAARPKPLLPPDIARKLYDRARELQKGDSIEVQEALDLYDYLIDKNISAAMVTKGRLHCTGGLLSKDFEKAFELFEKASELGNRNGTYQLAILYQKGLGTEQSFAKAFNLYKLAADDGHREACYETGNCLYKGLGTKQSYNKAINYFLKGAEKEHTGCYYMLAAYYMSGYDGKQDTLKAQQYLQKAFDRDYKTYPERAERNYEQINALRFHSEKTPDSWTDVKRKRLTPIKKSIRNDASQEELAGTWVGKLYTYDWSGKVIIKEEDMELFFEPSVHSVYLVWKDPVSQEIIATYDMELKNSFWQSLCPYNKPVSNLREISQSRYGIKKKGQQPILYADLRFACYDRIEFLEPAVAVLDKKSNAESSLEIIKIYPQPVKDEITIEFISSSAQKIGFEIYDLSGKKVFEKAGMNYSQGTHSEKLPVNLEKGNYILHVIGKESATSKAIVKQ